MELAPNPRYSGGSRRLN